MTKIVEHDARLEAKQRAEFITPQKLREFIASKVTQENFTLLDPAVGSGQLVFNLKNKIKWLTGYDVSLDVLAACEQNFNDMCDLHNQDFITAKNDVYDVCIANYPFSLKPTIEQKEAIKSDPFLSQFYKKEVTGLLDFIFILKSFECVREGYYLCFPGIGYRNSDQKFRDYLINNKLIKEVGILNNCEFDHTTISILYLHLSKEPSETAKSFSLDFKTNEYLEEQADFSDGCFRYPQKQETREKIDGVALELELRALTEKQFKAGYSLSKNAWNLDRELRESGIQSPTQWINDFFENFKKEYV